MLVAGIATQTSLWPTAVANAAAVPAQTGQVAADVAAPETSPANQSGSPATGTASATSPSQVEQTQAVAELQSTDQQVRAHEAAHLAAAGALASGGAQFTYATGPDRERYAVAGEVNISISEGRTPEETLQRAEQIRRAALAPADPSGQDLAVAAMASEMAAKARQQIAAEQVAAYTAQGAESGSLVDTSA